MSNHFLAVLLAFNAFSYTHAATDNLDYIKSAKDSSIDMLVEATKKYKAGLITKDEYVKVAMQAGQMSDYSNKVDSIKTISTNNKDSDLILIGTADNGKSKIYSVKQNSWDTKNGFKVRIIPDDPMVSEFYELLIPSPDSSKTMATDPAYLLSQIPASYNVDKSKTTGAPEIKYDAATKEGVWTAIASSEDIICIKSKDTPSVPQPSGSCSVIGEQKTFLSNPSYANDLIPKQKKCIDEGFQMFQLKMDFHCQPDFYLNKGGK